MIPLVDEGLGNSAYLVDLGDGRALVVDAARDLRAVRAAALRAGLRIAYAADTHLHADFLSGAVQLAATDGVQVLASATGGRQFPHLGLADGEEVELGGLRALATPGHTPEHVSFLLLDAGSSGEVPLGVLSPTRHRPDHHHRPRTRHQPAAHRCRSQRTRGRRSDRGRGHLRGPAAGRPGQLSHLLRPPR